jgi:chromosome segregation ATPase
MFFRYDSQYNELRDQLSAKTNELLQLEEEHEQLLQAHKADEEEFADLENRFDELQRIVEEKEKEILDCNQDIARLSETNRRLEEEQEMSMADANEADAVRAQVEEDMEAQKEHYELKMEGLKARLADAAAELADAHERVGIAEEDAEALKAKIEQYRERMKMRNQELEEAVATNVKLDEKVQDLLADLKDEERNRELDASDWEKRMGDLEDDLRRVIDEKEDVSGHRVAKSGHYLPCTDFAFSSTLPIGPRWSGRRYHIPPADSQGPRC